MVKYCKENLQEIKKMIVKLNDDHYQYKSVLLNGATIGQHVRHVLEFYICLIIGARQGIVNYDKRERDFELESNREFAIATIGKICNSIWVAGKCGEISLEGNFSSSAGKIIVIQTSVQRELAYCLEHSIHHQALISIVLKEQQVECFVANNFGIAPATIRYKATCAQ